MSHQERRNARYAIQKKDDEGAGYWVGPRTCSCRALPETTDLLTGPQADSELVRLKTRLPHVESNLSIVVMVVRRRRAAIFGRAFLGAIEGKELTPETLVDAKKAGMQALQLAGYPV